MLTKSSRPKHHSKELDDAVIQRIVEVINCELEKYLKSYNTQRLPVGIEFMTPGQITQKCFDAID